MMDEDSIRRFIRSLREGLEWDRIYRSSADKLKNIDDYAVVSFIPIKEKFNESLGNFIRKHENPNYNWYGYGEKMKVVIRTWVDDRYADGSGYHDPRMTSSNRIREIERFLKVNYNNLIYSGSINFYSFTPPKEIVNRFNTRQYGHEISFEVISPNIWTDYPDENPKSVYDLSGFEVESVDIDISDADIYAGDETGEHYVRVI